MVTKHYKQLKNIDNMLFKSATKLVFLLTAVTVCGSFFIGKISEQAFLQMATLVFSFYYSGKSTPITEKPIAKEDTLG